MKLLLLILQIAGSVYLLIVGAAILGLLLASIKTWIEIAFTAVRRCSRKHSKGGPCVRPSPRGKP